MTRPDEEGMGLGKWRCSFRRVFCHLEVFRHIMNYRLTIPHKSNYLKQANNCVVQIYGLMTKRKAALLQVFNGVKCLNGNSQRDVID